MVLIGAALGSHRAAQESAAFSAACLDLIDVAADRMLAVIEYEERMYPGLWDQTR